MTRKGMTWLESLIVVMIFAVLACAFSASPAFAQLATVSGTGAAPAAPGAPSLDLYPLGKNFGADGSFQFGIDKSATAGVCAGYDVPDHIFLAGPCRDILILAHKGAAVAHLGGFVGYGLADINRSHPYWSARAGVNVGPAVSAALNKLGDGVPAFDALSSYQAPAWASYMGSITTLDYFGGYNGHWVHGPQIKADIPIQDLLNLIRAAGGK
jgi:hypothetical protein